VAAAAPAVVCLLPPCQLPPASREPGVAEGAGALPHSSLLRTGPPRGLCNSKVFIRWKDSIDHLKLLCINVSLRTGPPRGLCNSKVFFRWKDSIDHLKLLCRNVSLRTGPPGGLCWESAPKLLVKICASPVKKGRAAARARRGPSSGKDPRVTRK